MVGLSILAASLHVEGVGLFSGFEIVRLADVGDETDLCGLPAEPLLRQSAGCRHVETGEHRERAGIVGALVDDLCRLSPEFGAMWRDNDVRGYGEGVKHIRHPIAGPIAFEYSAFAVDGRPDLGMVIYNPATPADAERIRLLIRSRPETSKKTA